MNIFRIDQRILSKIFFFYIRNVSIIVSMALVTIIIIIVVNCIVKCSTIMIEILQEDIIIIATYKVCTRSLEKEPIIGININHCFSLLQPQAVLAFAMHKRIHAAISFAQRCRAC
jgi:hypothetical protein